MDNSAADVDKVEALKDVMNNIYAQQYFDTTARQFTNDIFNESITQFLNQMPSLRESLMKAATAGKNNEQVATVTAEMDSRLAKLTMEFYALLEKNSDALEMYLYQHILTIPPEKVLDQDKAQVHYKKQIENLTKETPSHAPKLGNADTSSVSILTPKSHEKMRELLQRKCEKMRLEFEIELADKTLKRLESFENSVNLAMSSYDGSLKEFVLNNIAAVKTLPKLGEVLKLNK